MWYDGFVSDKNSPFADAFGRFRVSQITTQIDIKQLHDKLPLFINEELIGGATSVSQSRSKPLSRILIEIYHFGN